MTTPADIIGRPINVGDHVVFTNNVYVVKSVGKAYPSTGKGPVKIMLTNPSKTTRPQVKHSGDMCLLPETDVLVWQINNM